MAITIWQPVTHGDTCGDLNDHTHAAGQILLLLSIGTLVGDANSLFDHAVGGDDTLTSGGQAPDTVIGDALTNADHAIGGNDQLSASAKGGAVALGDALTISGHGHGANDNVSSFLPLMATRRRSLSTV